MVEENLLFEEHDGPKPPGVVHIFEPWVPKVLLQCHYLVAVGHSHQTSTNIGNNILCTRMSTLNTWWVIMAIWAKICSSCIILDDVNWHSKLFLI